MLTTTQQEIEMDMPQAPNAMSAPADDAPGSDSSAGFEISICVYADGTIKVSKGPLDDDPQGGEDEGTPVLGFGAALKEALNLYQAEASGGDSDLVAGFGGATQARRAKLQPVGL
jgi:hypothetical protein